jgi:hypothetical protein
MLPFKIEVIVEGKKVLRQASHLNVEHNYYVPMMKENEFLIRSMLGTIYIYSYEEY